MSASPTRDASESLNEAGVSSPRVAVIDDDPRIRALLEDAFFDYGIKSDLCAGVAEFVAHLRQHSVDLVLMDVAMPEISGLDGLQRLRQAAYDGVVLMLTAIDDPSIRQACLQAGASEYILKNDLFDRLPDLLQRYLQLNPAAL